MLKQLYSKGLKVSGKDGREVKVEKGIIGDCDKVSIHMPRPQ